MKKFLDNVNTPDGWEDKLYAEIERRESKAKPAVPRFALRLCAGAVAVCAAFALVFTLAPKNENYVLLTSAEEVAYAAEIGLENLNSTTKYAGWGNYTYPWYKYPDGDALNENGNFDAIVYAQMPVRVYGENIESVTFIPTNDNVEVSLVKYISGATHGDGSVNGKVVSMGTAGEDISYGEESKSVTLSYEEQFDRDLLYALKWVYEEDGYHYDEISGQNIRYTTGAYAMYAVRTTRVNVEIKMKSGRIAHDSIDVFLQPGTTSIRKCDRVIFKKDIYADKKD